MSTQMFFVGYTDDDGDNHDQYVEAQNEQEALALWQAEYKSWRDCDATTGVKVWRVPTLTGTPCLAPWGEALIEL